MNDDFSYSPLEVTGISYMRLPYISVQTLAHILSLNHKTMKLLPLFVLFTISILTTDQHNSPDTNYQEVIEARFEGGVEGFESYVYSRMRYPRSSRQNCEMGEGYITMRIGEGGEIVEINQMNNLTPALDQEIMQTMKLTAGKWKKGEKESLLKMSVGFQIGLDQEIEGDLKVTALSPNNDQKGCGTNQELEAKYKRAYDKGKQRKAKKLIEELLRRDPFNSQYKKMEEALQEL